MVSRRFLYKKSDQINSTRTKCEKSRVYSEELFCKNCWLLRNQPAKAVIPLTCWVNAVNEHFGSGQWWVLFGFSSKCHRLCTWRERFPKNFMEQTSHSSHSSPSVAILWVVAMCLCKIDLSLNTLSHLVQWKPGLVSCCRFMWSFKEFFLSQFTDVALHWFESISVLIWYLTDVKKGGKIQKW